MEVISILQGGGIVVGLEVISILQGGWNCCWYGCDFNFTRRVELLLVWK